MTWRDRQGRIARWPDLIEATQFRMTRVVLAAAHAQIKRLARSGLPWVCLRNRPVLGEEACPAVYNLIVRARYW